MLFCRFIFAAQRILEVQSKLTWSADNFEISGDVCGENQVIKYI